jgi:glucose-6-phosphate dehydrogenase assembly protein OpcA
VATATGGVIRAGHASGLHAVSRELAELRAALLRTGDETRGVRLSVLTLVVACADRAAADEAAQAVDRLAADHPTRAIVVVGDPTAPAGIDADLSLSCSISRAGQVCVELVRLTVGGESARHLRSVVSPLLLPDVPVHLWLAGAPPLEQALQPHTLEICERLILDSDAYPDPLVPLTTLVRALEAAPRLPGLGDLAWSRILPWREQLGRAFDSPELRGYTQGIDTADIRCSGRAPSAQARLLAGWLTSRLRRRGEEGPRVGIGCEHAGDDGGAVRAVTVHARSRDRRAEVEIRREGDRLVTAVSVEGPMRSSSSTSTLPVEWPGAVDMVGGQLEEQGVDAVHIAALRAATAGGRP